MSDLVSPDELAVSVEPTPVRRGFVRRFRRQRLALFCLGLIFVLCVVAAFATQLAPYDPNTAGVGPNFAGPSGAHWLGTDQLGRDTLSRLILATRTAMIAGLEAVVVALVLGVPVGLIAGYVGGWLDRIVMRLIDVFLALPALLVALAIIAALGTGLVNAMFAVGVLFAIRVARLVRGSVLSVREELYLEAARLSGASSGRILARYVLPNVAIPLVVEVALYFGVALLVEAMLSFLGVGVRPPQATWGVMLSEARTYVNQDGFLAIPPGIMITLTVLAFNLIADGLSTALNPRAVSRIRRRRADRRGAETLPEPAYRSAAPEDAILSVRDLRVTLAGQDGPIPVLRGVDLDVRRGEVLGLVGESGSGKSMTSLAVMGLLPANARVEGSIRCDGTELGGASERVWRSVRGARIAMIFQEPAKALDPSMTVGRQIAETVRLHRRASRREAWEEAVRLLGQVGVKDPETRVDDYPHQFSGGMAQRVVIAIALACRPDLLVADEPTTALDVTTQAQVLDLLLELREETGIGILFITHDLGVVADVCDRAAVMYAGQIVETAPVETLFADPAHPYTRALIEATPGEADVERLRTIPGQVPRPEQLGAGCAFAGRCPVQQEECTATAPRLASIDEGHSARCLLVAGSPEIRPNLEEAR